MLNKHHHQQQTAKTNHRGQDNNKSDYQSSHSIYFRCQNRTLGWLLEKKSGGSDIELMKNRH